MVRRGSWVIGLGLALFWWLGLSLNHNAGLLWFDALGAVLAFGIGGLVDDSVEHRPSYALGPAILGLGLAVVWIAGLASGQPAWVSWPNFAFACASLAVAIMTVSSQRLELTNRA